MAEEKKPRRKPFLEEVEDAILDAGFPVINGDGSITTPEDRKKTEETE